MLSSLLLAIFPALTSGLPGLEKGDMFDLQETPVLTTHGFISGVLSLQSDGEHFCTGVLINPTTVLTDSKCSARRPGTTSVVMYPFRQNQKSVVFKVGRVFTDEFKGLSVWKVELVSGNSSDLPASPFILDDGTYSKFPRGIAHVRWNLEIDTPFRNNMTVTKLIIVPTDVCEKRFNDVRTSDICAVQFGPTKAVMRNYIQHRPFFKSTIGYTREETGTPAFAMARGNKVVLVGFTSYLSCDFESYPCVFSSIRPVVDWIRTLSKNQ